jgi:hypothetical protein
MINKYSIAIIIFVMGILAVSGSVFAQDKTVANTMVTSYSGLKYTLDSVVRSVTGLFIFDDSAKIQKLIDNANTDLQTASQLMVAGASDSQLEMANGLINRANSYLADANVLQTNLSVSNPTEAIRLGGVISEAQTRVGTVAQTLNVFGRTAPVQINQEPETVSLSHGPVVESLSPTEASVIADIAAFRQRRKELMDHAVEFMGSGSSTIINELRGIYTDRIYYFDTAGKAILKATKK